MMDNFDKIILLTPDLIFDTTIDEMHSEDLLQVFKDYKNLEDISVDTLLENGGSLAFIEIPNSLFDFMITRILINKGRMKLVSYMQIFSEERRIILCLAYNEFKELIEEYKSILIEKKNDLISEVNQITNELFLLNKIKLGGM